MEIRDRVPPAFTPPAAVTRAAPAAARETRGAPAAPGADGLREAALWDVLTPEERAFFEQQAALGPLTYGRPRTTGNAAPTGQRLDVRG